MTRRHEVMEALNGVVAEHDAARRALGFLLAAAGRDPSLLGSEDPTFADLRLCLRNLERTYLVRLFALFEENLREVWTLSLERPTEPLAKDLLDGCASRQAIRDDGLLRETHQVR